MERMQRNYLRFQRGIAILKRQFGRGASMSSLLDEVTHQGGSKVDPVVAKVSGPKHG